VRKYLEAYQNIFSCGAVLEDTIQHYIDTYLLIDNYLPDSANYFYVKKFPERKYSFIGRHQEKVSGYANEEVKQRGIELFLQAIHPDQLDLIVHGVYPDIADFLGGLADDQEKKSVLIQYTYMLKRKNGPYVNLLESNKVLELDDIGRPAVLLGNVIMLHDSELRPSPLRLTIKRFGRRDEAEKVFSKVYTCLQTKENITAREIDILCCLASGDTSKGIGLKLCISPHTVDTHRRSLLKKLNCRNVVELTRLALRHGLL